MLKNLWIESAPVTISALLLCGDALFEKKKNRQTIPPPPQIYFLITEIIFLVFL